MKGYRLVIGVCVVGVGGILSSNAIDNYYSFDYSQKKELAKEYPPSNEEECTQKIISLLKKRLEKDFPPPARTLRDAHPKQHGLVKAEFTVLDDIDNKYKIGLFAKPHTYQSWIRFSNLNGGGEPDIAKDSRGMAIKLMGVKGKKILAGEENAPTQDFVFMSTPIFVTKGVKGFAKLLKAVNSGKVCAGLHFLTHPRLLKLFMKIRIQVASLFDIEWGSTTPYLLGDKAVKYAVLPTQASHYTIPEGDDVSDNYLRERMAADLSKGDIMLDFYIQEQIDPDKMPIEDPRIEWDRTLSPFVKVATIKILKQTFDTPEQQLYGDWLSFSPWHCLPEHRPLGGINRGRKAIYQTMSKFRHERNGEISVEPSEWVTF